MPARIGPYVVERRLGSGGMSIVYAGRDCRSGAAVALKVVRPAIGSGERLAHARLRLLREAWVLSQIRAPNVVGVLDVVATADQMFLVMELVHGMTLELWLCEPRSWQEIVGAYVDAGRGLEALHDLGVVHRDFKPANVLVGADGRIRLVDFGLAVPEGMGPAFSGIVMGTPSYMAPEQRHGAPASSASDQYSFCAALSEALSVFRKPGQHAAAPPRQVWEVLEQGLRIDPTRRHPSLSVLLRDLRAILRRRGLKQRRRRPAPRPGAPTAATKALPVRPRAPRPRSAA